jgi:hypothetical protein
MNDCRGADDDARRSVGGDRHAADDVDDDPRRRQRGGAFLTSASHGPLFPRQNGGQIPEFGFHFGGIGHRIRDFLAEEFAVPLAKPVNGHFERSL